VRLTAKLTHWHIDIMTEEQARRLRELDRAEIYKLPDVPEGLPEKLLLGGITSLKILVAKGAGHLETMYGLSEPKSIELVEYAKQRETEIVSERQAAAEKAAADKAAAQQAGAAAVPSTETAAAGAPAVEGGAQ